MDPVIQNLNLITMIFQRAAILASIGVKQAGHGGYSNGTFNTMELRMPDGMELYLEIRESQDDNYQIARYEDHS